jgi:hypothetical protein
MSREGEKNRMKCPKYKEFGYWIEPIIKKRFGKILVYVLAKDQSANETTTGLTSDELRKLADYLDYLKFKQGGGEK